MNNFYYKNGKNKIYYGPNTPNHPKGKGNEYHLFNQVIAIIREANNKKIDLTYIKRGYIDNGFLERRIFQNPESIPEKDVDSFPDVTIRTNICITIFDHFRIDDSKTTKNGSTLVSAAGNINSINNDDELKSLLKLKNMSGFLTENFKSKIIEKINKIGNYKKSIREHIINGPNPPDINLPFESWFIVEINFTNKISKDFIHAIIEVLRNNQIISGIIFVCNKFYSNDIKDINNITIVNNDEYAYAELNINGINISTE